MAEAMINGCSKRNIQCLENTFVYDPDLDRLKYMKDRYPGLHTSVDLEVAMEDAELIVLSFKPQNLSTVAKHVDLEHSDAIICSIMAGVSICDIESQLHTNRIIRSMPNTPAMILEGMTVWYAQVLLCCLLRMTFKY